MSNNYEDLKTSVIINFTENVGRTITGEAVSRILSNLDRAYRIGVTDGTEDYSKKLSTILSSTLSESKGRINGMVESVRVEQDKENSKNFEFELERLLSTLETWIKGE